jgi:hypothetical protein
MPGEREDTPEQRQPVYTLAYQFAQEAKAAQAYARVQMILYTEVGDQRLTAF